MKINPSAPIFFFITQNISAYLFFHSLVDNIKWEKFYTPLSSNTVSSLIKLLIKKKYENIRLWCVLGGSIFWV